MIYKIWLSTCTHVLKFCSVLKVTRVDNSILFPMIPGSQNEHWILISEKFFQEIFCKFVKITLNISQISEIWQLMILHVESTRNLDNSSLSLSLNPCFTGLWVEPSLIKLGFQVALVHLTSSRPLIRFGPDSWLD